MTYPICSRIEIPKGVGRIDTQGTRVYLNVKINGLYMTKEKIIDKVKNYERGKIAWTHHS